MVKYLITGGAGFIGSHLANELIKEADVADVTILDNFYRKNSLQRDERVKLVEGDITDPAIMDDLVSKHDVVFHLASISQVMISLKDPELTFKINVVGTKNVVDACVKYGKKIIFASSREVYGNPNSLPAGLLAPLKPENPYAFSKVTGEFLIKSYASSFGLKYNILRLSNVYGFGDVGRVIPIFMEKSLKNEEITVYGNDKLIDFVHVDDCINAFLKVKDRDGIILNVGSGETIELGDLAKKIVELSGSSSKIERKDERKGEIDRYCADISETEKVLGWKPRIKLDEGLKMIIEEYRKSI